MDLRRTGCHPVQVGICAIAMPLICLWHVVVDDNVDTFNVNATTNEVSGHQDALLALLKRLVHLQPAHEAIGLSLKDDKIPAGPLLPEQHKGQVHQA